MQKQKTMRYQTSDYLDFDTATALVRKLFGFTPKYNVVATEEYAIGDKIGQLIIMPYPKVTFNEVDFLYPSDRGED